MMARVKRRDVDMDEFPIGSRVITPSGRAGTVIRHKGYESKRDSFLRVIVRYDGRDRRALVTLQPRLLRKVQTAVRVEVSSWQQMEFEGWD